MCTIRVMLQRWQGFNIIEEAGEVITEQKDGIISLEKSQLYDKSQTATGDNLKEYKSKPYALKKNRMHPEVGYGNPDYFLTGNWQSQLDLQVSGDKINYLNPSSITQYLIKRDGEAIMGLTDDSKQQAWSLFVRAPFVQRLAEQTMTTVS